MIACGGDDTTAGFPGSDASVDGTVGTDGSTTGDASNDASPADGGDGSTGTTDGGDSGSDGGDVSTAVLAQTFANNLAKAFCTNVQAACTTYDAGAGVDGGVVDLTNCEAAVIKGGTPLLEGSTYGVLVPSALSYGGVVYDDQQAQRCVAEVGNLNLSNLNSAPYLTATSDCFAALQGSKPAGSPCYASLECAPHLYCDLGAYDAGTPDAGGDAAAPPTGLCSAILGQGADCTANIDRGDSCSYLGSQLDNAFCDSYNSVTCIEGLLNTGDACPYDLSCKSGICGQNPDDLADPSDFICLTATNFLAAGQLCTLYPPTP